MIENLSSWAQGVIISVIIVTIIEMILPEGKNKKYIKMILGVYVLFSIISPIASRITKRNSVFSISEYEEYFKDTNTNMYVSKELIKMNDKTKEELFISNLKSDIRSKIVGKGYIVSNIEIDVELKQEEKYGEIKIIKLIIENKAKDSGGKIKVEKIKVNGGNKSVKNEVSAEEISAIKKFLSEEYLIESEKIHINSL